MAPSLLRDPWISMACRSHFGSSVVGTARVPASLHITSHSSMAVNNDNTMHVLAVGDEATLCRPCVDCGVKTERFCDFCYSLTKWLMRCGLDNQLVPLCSRCNWAHGACHFCRGLVWCMPRPREPHRRRRRRRHHDTAPS